MSSTWSRRAHTGIIFALTIYLIYTKEKIFRAGICKIVPPKEWVPRREGYNPADIEGIDIKPVQQVCIVRVGMLYRKQIAGHRSWQV